MGRPRKYSEPLPKYVRPKHGAYWYVRNGKWTRLGRTLAEMYAGLSKIHEPSPAGTMGAVFDRYEREVLPGKAEKTRRDNFRSLKLLRAVFERVRIDDMTPLMGYEYRDRRSRGGKKTAANRDLEVLKHCFTMAIEWGMAGRNPMADVRKFPRVRRDRYVTDDEYALVWSVARPVIQIAMDLALMTGLRRGDLLRLTRADLTDDGILVKTSKTGKALLIEWSAELEQVVARAKRLPPHVRQHLIATRSGKPFTPDGFSTEWGKTLRAARAAGLAEAFTFHDLRAKSGSDEATLAEASARLGHASQATTERFYRRLPARVRPLKRGAE